MLLWSCKVRRRKRFSGNLPTGFLPVAPAEEFEGVTPASPRSRVPVSDCKQNSIDRVHPSGDGCSSRVAEGADVLLTVSLEDDVAMPAPLVEAAELSELTKRSIVDTGTAYNLISASAAGQGPDSIVEVPPCKSSQGQ